MPHRYWLGKKRSEETKKKISESKKGKSLGHKNKCQCPICKAKRGEAAKGKNHPMFGKKHSEESRKKMSESVSKNPSRYWLGKKRSEETKKKISAIQRGISITQWEYYVNSSRGRKERLKNNKKFHLNARMSGAINDSLRNGKRGKSWKKLVNFTVDDLINHLQSQFDENMSWENYGSYWHIDHVIPKSWFIFESPEDIGFKMCWDLENLQPLEKTENFRKGNRYIY